MAGGIQSPNTFQDWDVRINSYIEDEQSKILKGDYNYMFNVSTTNRLDYTDKTYAANGPLQEVGDLGDSPIDEDTDGFRTVYSRQTYRLSKGFSSNLVETDQHGEVEKRARNLPRTLEYTRDLKIFGYIRNAFTPTQLLSDGKPLASTGHLRYDGGAAQTNTFADGVQRPLTYDNALALRDVLRSTVSGSGNLLSLGASKRKACLWVARDLQEEAFQIADVGSVLKPDTADNNRNFFVEGANFDVAVLDFVSYEAARQNGETAVAKTSNANYWDRMWGVCDVESMKQYFNVLIGVGYSNGVYDEEVVKKNQVLMKYANDKYAYGASSFLGFTASKGDGTSYLL